MTTTDSLATAVDNSLFNNFMAFDGAVARIRDGQTAICTAFGGLSIPDGATIFGIEIEMVGYAGVSDLDSQVGNWISVSNNGGSSFSTAQSVTTEPWSTNSGAPAVETAGGTSELWGESWNATTAAAIVVKFGWGTSGGDAVYLDYVKVRVTYSVPSTYTSDDQASLSSGLLEFKNGITIIG